MYNFFKIIMDPRIKAKVDLKPVYSLKKMEEIYTGWCIRFLEIHVFMQDRHHTFAHFTFTCSQGYISWNINFSPTTRNFRIFYFLAFPPFKCFFFLFSLPLLTLPLPPPPPHTLGAYQIGRYRPQRCNKGESFFVEIRPTSNRPVFFLLLFFWR